MKSEEEDIEEDKVELIMKEKVIWSQVNKSVIFLNRTTILIDYWFKGKRIKTKQENFSEEQESSLCSMLVNQDVKSDILIVATKVIYLGMRPPLWKRMPPLILRGRFETVVKDVL